MVTVSAALVSTGTATTTAIGTATMIAAEARGIGAPTTGVTNTANMDTGGAFGSNTVFNVGSAKVGAGAPRQ